MLSCHRPRTYIDLHWSSSCLAQLLFFAAKAQTSAVMHLSQYSLHLDPSTLAGPGNQHGNAAAAQASCLCLKDCDVTTDLHWRRGMTQLLGEHAGPSIVRLPHSFHQTKEERCS